MTGSIWRIRATGACVAVAMAFGAGAAAAQQADAPAEQTDAQNNSVDAQARGDQDPGELTAEEKADLNLQTLVRIEVLTKRAAALSKGRPLTQAERAQIEALAIEARVVLEQARTQAEDARVVALVTRLKGYLDQLKNPSKEDEALLANRDSEVSRTLQDITDELLALYPEKRDRLVVAQSTPVLSQIAAANEEIEKLSGGDERDDVSGDMSAEERAQLRALLSNVTKLVAAANATNSDEIERVAQALTALLNADADAAASAGPQLELLRAALNTAAPAEPVGAAHGDQDRMRVLIVAAHFGDWRRQVRRKRVCDATQVVVGRCEGRERCNPYSGPMLCGFDPAPVTAARHKHLVVSYACLTNAEFEEVLRRSTTGHSRSSIYGPYLRTATIASRAAVLRCGP